MKPAEYGLGEFSVNSHFMTTKVSFTLKENRHGSGAQMSGVFITVVISHKLILLSTNNH